MATGNRRFTLKDANLRLCRLCKWSNYTGLGFNLKPGSNPPYSISVVESNSPAAAAGLKINDVILAVNKDDMKKVKYEKLTQSIQKARDKNDTIDLLVMEKRFYDQVLTERIKIDPKQAKTISAPKTMPDEYANFPKHIPRICVVHLTDAKESFGFELVNGENDIGVFIQEAHPNTPASIAGLRKSDRVISIDDELVYDKVSSIGFQKLREAKAKLNVKLFVMDTQTYKHYRNNNMPLEPAQTSEKVPTTRPVASDHYMNVTDSDSDSDSDTTSPAAPVRPISDQDGSRGVSALVKKPSSHYAKPTAPLDSESSDEDTRSKSDSKANQHTSVQPSSGISAIAKNNPIEPNASEEISRSNRRKYQLYRDKKIGYGFILKTKTSGKYPNQIGEITPNSPAEQEGLRVNDYILTANNKNVQNMNNDAFKSFLRTSAAENESRGEPLSLEVINEDALLSRRASASTKPESIKPAVVERYPEMRRCTIRPWSAYRDLGFEISQSPNTFGGGAGYQIKSLKRNSPAQKAEIRNDDYIIEVNRLNIENDDFEDLRDNIRNIYKKDKEIELLVIDEEGYEWYKSHKHRIDSRAPEARITPHRTPESPPGSTRSRNDTDIISKPYRPPTEPYTPPVISATNGSSKIDKPVDLITSPYEKDQSSSQQAGTSMISKGSDRPLSRGAVDVVSEKRLLRFYRLWLKPGEKIGFSVAPDNRKHIIRNIKPNSPAERNGLQEADCIVEVNDQNVENTSTKEVIDLLITAAYTGNVRLLVAPSNVKILTKRSGKSLQNLNDEHLYGNLPTQSSSQLNNNGINGDRSNMPDDINSFSLEPTDPLPRRCVLFRDSNFNGCGFRIIEKRNYDTPIVVEVCPNSPAKRSGLSEGDHIVYIQSKNIQNFDSFDEKINYIKREFEETGQIALVTLTGPAFQILKQRGGYLEGAEFDYQSPNTDRMQPRLCKLNFHAHEQDYGLSFRRDNVLYIKNVESGSSADAYGIRKGNIVLELNGQDVKYLTENEIKEILDKSKQNRSLDILIIDINGYRYAIHHAIPLNSLLPFVQTHKGRTTTTNGHHSNETVYL
ncbi:hypothetical protein I4U23_019199 [Adineta vaga]|nr:hypothetical protein I4U23_019199 [Adineta vaga]